FHGETLWPGVRCKSMSAAARPGFRPFGYRIRQRIDRLSPASALLLTEESHRRIPRAVLAGDEPSAVGNEWKQEPRLRPQGPGEMGNRCVHGDHQVQA